MNKKLILKITIPIVIVVSVVIVLIFNSTRGKNVYSNLGSSGSSEKTIQKWKSDSETDPLVVLIYDNDTKTKNSKIESLIKDVKGDKKVVTIPYDGKELPDYFDKSFEISKLTLPAVIVYNKSNTKTESNVKTYRPLFMQTLTNEDDFKIAKTQLNYFIN